MTQLWAWEYNGKTEFGWKQERTPLSLYVAQDFLWSPIRNISRVTDLRKVKVVDEDAIVFDKKVIDHWENLLSEKKWNQLLDSVKLEIEQTPPITKTYLTTDQFIKVWQSLNDDKRKELSVARSAAWYAARSAAWYAARNAAWDAAWYAAWSAAWSAAWNAAWDAAWDAAWYAAWSAAWSAAWNATWDTDLAILVKDKISDEHFEILTSPWTSCGLSLYAEDWDAVLNPKVTEPKGFGAIVEAGVNGFGNRVSLVSINGRWWSRNNLDFRWSELINPTIISEGVSEG